VFQPCKAINDQCPLQTFTIYTHTKVHKGHCWIVVLFSSLRIFIKGTIFKLEHYLQFIIYLVSFSYILYNTTKRYGRVVGTQLRIWEVPGSDRPLRQFFVMGFPSHSRQMPACPEVGPDSIFSHPLKFIIRQLSY
jgi:hypothetical protein